MDEFDVLLQRRAGGLERPSFRTLPPLTDDDAEILVLCLVHLDQRARVTARLLSRVRQPAALATGPQGCLDSAEPILSDPFRTLFLVDRSRALLRVDLGNPVFIILDRSLLVLANLIPLTLESRLFLRRCWRSCRARDWNQR